MNVNKCNRCDKLYAADAWSDSCPFCGGSGGSVDSYEFFKCSRCDKVFVADPYAGNCPHCGGYGSRLRIRKPTSPRLRTTCATFTASVYAGGRSVLRSAPGPFVRGPIYVTGTTYTPSGRR